MHGKTVLITGANSGIGFVTAMELAKKGARILMVCRDAARGTQARAAVAEAASGEAPELSGSWPSSCCGPKTHRNTL